MKHNSVDNSQDVIDSRDIIARISDLVDERRNLDYAVDEAKEALAEAEPHPEHFTDWASVQERMQGTITEAQSDLADWDNSDDAEELKVLQALADEDISEWEDGATLIRDSYFETYAMELADDIGAIKGTEGWPLTCIDWEKATRELKYDYLPVDFDGVEYWYRS